MRLVYVSMKWKEKPSSLATLEFYSNSRNQQRRFTCICNIFFKLTFFLRTLLCCIQHEAMGKSSHCWFGLIDLWEIVKSPHLNDLEKKFNDPGRGKIVMILIVDFKDVSFRAPNGSGRTEKKNPMRFFIFLWSGAPWSELELGSLVHVPARYNQLVGWSADNRFHLNAFSIQRTDIDLYQNGPNWILKICPYRNDKSYAQYLCLHFWLVLSASTRFHHDLEILKSRKI